MKKFICLTLGLVPFFSYAETEVKLVDGGVKKGYFTVSIEIKEKNQRYHELIDGKILNCSGDGPLMIFKNDEGEAIQISMKDMDTKSLNYEILRKVCGY